MSRGFFGVEGLRFRVSFLKGVQNIFPGVLGRDLQNAFVKVPIGEMLGLYLGKNMETTLMGYIGFRVGAQKQKTYLSFKFYLTLQE